MCQQRHQRGNGNTQPRGSVEPLEPSDRPVAPPLEAIGAGSPSTTRLSCRLRRTAAREAIVCHSAESVAPSTSTLSSQDTPA